MDTQKYESNNYIIHRRLVFKSQRLILPSVSGQQNRIASDE